MNERSIARLVVSCEADGLRALKFISHTLLPLSAAITQAVARNFAGHSRSSIPATGKCSSTGLRTMSKTERRNLSVRQGSSFPGVSMGSSVGQFRRRWSRQWGRREPSSVLCNRDRPASPDRLGCLFLYNRRRLIPVIMIMDDQPLNYTNPANLRFISVSQS